MNDMHPVGPGMRRKGGRTLKAKLAPDTTPLVGLGFLLVAFFLMTMHFAKPLMIQLIMPVRSTCGGDGFPELRSGFDNLTLILGKNHQVHYCIGPTYSRDEQPVLHTTNLGSAGLRQLLLTRLREYPKTMVLIKPGPGTKYQDLVDALDEMNITDQKKYAVVDLYPHDQALLDAYCL